MANKMDKLMEDMQKELDAPAPEAGAGTPPATAEDGGAPNPDGDGGEPEAQPAGVNPPEPNPEPNPEGNPPEPQKKPSDFTPQERADHAFRRQLAKQKAKHDAELKERDEKYAALEKRFAELEKKVTPKTELRREDFKDDEDFIRALQQEEIKKALEARDEKHAEEARKQAESDAQAQRERQELEEQQQLFLDNVDSAFGGDEKRKTEFFQRVQYCSKRGLNEILDKVPVVADFLMYNPRGPVVFERMLSDRKAFERVFNERMSSPMDIYYELRKLDTEIGAGAAPAGEQPPAEQPPAQGTPAPSAVPHLGRPGKQAGSGTAPDIFTDKKAMLEFLRTR